MSDPKRRYMRRTTNDVGQTRCNYCGQYKPNQQMCKPAKGSKYAVRTICYRCRRAQGWAPDRRNRPHDPIYGWARSQALKELTRRHDGEFAELVAFYRESVASLTPIGTRLFVNTYGTCTRLHHDRGAGFMTAKERLVEAATGVIWEVQAIGCEDCRAIGSDENAHFWCHACNGKGWVDDVEASASYRDDCAEKVEATLASFLAHPDLLLAVLAETGVLTEETGVVSPRRGAHTMSKWCKWCGRLAVVCWVDPCRHRMSRRSG